jgi:hypothetical protein
MRVVWDKQRKRDHHICLEATGDLILPGQAIDIDLPEAPKPNEKVLAMLRELGNRKKDMAESDLRDTDEIIRQGRSGAMYGD